MIKFSLEVEKYREEFLCLLDQWIRINSVYSEISADDKNIPFGKGVAEALDWFIDLGEKDGFVTKNVDGYASHIEYGIGEEYVYVFGHCDVVPAGEGWNSEPFKLFKSGDNLIGRGVVDDKGPLLAAYLALKLLKDNNIMPNRKIRIVAGGNEESGFRCIKHYFKKEPKPTFGFTPDAKFPVINGEMGAAIININGIIQNKTLIIKGGEAHNTIPDYVNLKGCSVKEKSEELMHFLEEEKVSIGQIEIKNKERGFKIIGMGGHSSKPEKANNPIEKTLKLLSKVLKENWIHKLEPLFGGNNLDGRLFKLNISGKCGEFKLVPTIISIEKGRINLTLNVRYPETLTQEEILNNIKEYFISQRIDGYEISCTGIKKPSYVDENSPLVRKLYDVYLKHTGDTENKIRVTSAGTYASEMENSVVFGGEFPDGSSGNVHRANEYGSENNLIKSIGIYAEALYELSKL